MEPATNFTVRPTSFREWAGKPRPIPASRPGLHGISATPRRTISLLDWSRSPYVAAYFAFRGAGPLSDKVAIFAYQERPSGMKSIEQGRPYIRNVGPYIQTDPRHFLQQCQYTVCTGRSSGAARYFLHEDVFSSAPSNTGEQDLLHKFTLPAHERSAALGQLDLYNINGYSLMGSTEGLIEWAFLAEQLHNELS